MQLKLTKHSWPLEHPFRITGYTFTHTNAVWVELEDNEHTGRGEGVGIYYLGDTVDSMIEEIEAHRREIESGVSRDQLMQLMLPGGARNAVDCALWDLESKRAKKSIFELTRLESNPVQTVATIGIGDDEFMAMRAQDFSSYQNLKIKLDAERPVERVAAIRSVRPDATLVIDANQAWDLELLSEIVGDLDELGVAMIEQPVPRGADQQLAGFDSPIPLGADESCLNLAEYDAVAPYYQVINIKLDKCGGLTEAFEIAERALEDGKQLMVGNMTGSSLSMAPAFVLAQLCKFVDIDGPLLMQQDIEGGLEYQPGGWVQPPTRELWG